MRKVSEYLVAYDLKTIRSILGLSQEMLADALQTSQENIALCELGKSFPSTELLERIYSFSYWEGIRLNRLKEMMWKESLQQSHRLLFHGSKNVIKGPIDVHIGRNNNDFGQGFYAGEKYEQAATFVAAFDKSSVYYLDFDPKGLTEKRYQVDQNWMLTIAYYRGALKQYQNHPMVKKLIRESKACDYVVAPIADNQMYQIINSFIEGEITDEQCKHCLAATNLGAQYVFLNEKSASHVRVLERCYIPINEREHYATIRGEQARLGSDKVKLARIQYRGKGKYIDELLKSKED